MKVFISEKSKDGLPLSKLNINDINSFEGLIFDCEQLEPIFNRVILKGQETLINVKHILRVHSDENGFIEEIRNKDIIIWIISDNFVYGNVEFGINANVNNHNSTIYYYSKNYPPRTQIKSVK